MRCLYIILSIQLLNNSVFSNDSFLGLRNTIAEYGHTESVSLLLAAGAKINAKSNVSTFHFDRSSDLR